MKKVYKLVPADNNLLLWELVRVHILIPEEVEQVILPYAEGRDIEVDIMTDYATPSRVEITMVEEDAIIISLLLRDEIKLQEVSNES